MERPLRLLLRTPPATEPLTLSDVKSYMGVTSSTDDTMITSLIVAVREFCEDHLKRSLITQEWSMFLDKWPSSESDEWWDGVREGAHIRNYVDFISLPKNPVVTVDAVKIYATDDTSTTWASSNYAVDIYSMKARLALSASGTPPVPTRKVNGIEVRYTAGYGASGSDVPNSILEGMKMMIFHMYENKGCSCSGGASASGAKNIWSKFVVTEGM